MSSEISPEMADLVVVVGDIYFGKERRRMETAISRMAAEKSAENLEKMTMALRSFEVRDGIAKNLLDCPNDQLKQALRGVSCYQGEPKNCHEYRRAIRVALEYVHEDYVKTSVAR